MQIKLEKINILNLIHYFQSHNFIDSDSILNKTQNRKRVSRFSKETHRESWLLRWEANDQVDLELLMASWRWSSASWRRRSASTLSWSGDNGGDPAAAAIFVAQSQREKRERVREGLVCSVIYLFFIFLIWKTCTREREREKE